MTPHALRTLGAVVVALACIMQGECGVIPDGAHIAGHVALNRRVWYDDVRTGFNGCADVDDIPREYLWLAWDVLRSHHSVDDGYVFAVSAEDCERLGLPQSGWYFEETINGETWGVYAYKESEWQ